MDGKLNKNAAGMVSTVMLGATPRSEVAIEGPNWFPLPDALATTDAANKMYDEIVDYALNAAANELAAGPPPANYVPLLGAFTVEDTVTAMKRSLEDGINTDAFSVVETQRREWKNDKGEVTRLRVVLQVRQGVVEEPEPDPIPEPEPPKRKPRQRRPKTEPKPKPTTDE